MLVISPFAHFLGATIIIVSCVDSGWRASFVHETYRKQGTCTSTDTQIDTIKIAECIEDGGKLVSVSFEIVGDFVIRRRFDDLCSAPNTTQARHVRHSYVDRRVEARYRNRNSATLTDACHG